MLFRPGLEIHRPASYIVDIMHQYSAPNLSLLDRTTGLALLLVLLLPC